jgi:hypothetical protein
MSEEDYCISALVGALKEATYGRVEEVDFDFQYIGPV